VENQKKFEIIEEFESDSVWVRLRRQLDYKPSRYTSGPYWLDLRAGGVHRPHYCVSESIAREAAIRFLAEHEMHLAPTRN